MVLPLAIGAVVDGVPTTFQIPLSGHVFTVRAVAPISASLAPHSTPAGWFVSTSQPSIVLATDREGTCYVAVRSCG